MILLQTQVSGSFDGVAVAMWMIGGLLLLIVTLIAVIWQDNKTQSASKHTDLVNLITKLDGRQDKLDERQQVQAFQIIALDTAVKIIQGHPVDLNNLDYKQEPKRTP